MKLAAFALLTTVGLAGTAHADPARPRGEFRQLLLGRFDRNHDGVLQPDERRRAVRTLRRLARRLAAEDRGAGWAQRPGLVRRFDANGDGVVSPDELRAGRARMRAQRGGDGGAPDDRDR